MRRTFDQKAEKDLDMFSIFDRTGVPQKGAPTKAQFFLIFATW